ncbi:hypothetical protein ACFW91_11100 [Streptomyces asoensis]|uniref:hypothetical protein n=1 Tax=Streptomyces asoensis TaxID=249586 RepID=UPI00367D3D47
MSPRSGPALTQGAGWLFADLLLVVALVVLGGQWTPGDDGTPGPGEPSAASPAPGTASAGASRTAKPGLDPDSEEFDVRTDAVALRAGKAAAERAVREQVTAHIKDYPGRTAAMVIVWGTAASCGTCPVTDDASRAYAHAVATRLTSIAPGFFPPYDADIIRSYRNTSSDRAAGTATVELFFLRT